MFFFRILYFEAYQGNDIDEDWQSIIDMKAMAMTACGKPEYVKEQIAISLERLGVEYLDLYYVHR